MQPTLPGTTPVPARVYVVFIAEVVPQTTEALIQALSNLAQNGVQEVYLGFSTPGGSVMHGMTLYNFLCGAPFNLIVHNLGNVDSIGNAIFLAGRERYACPHSTFMFHGVGFDRPAGRLEEKALREMLDGIESDQRRIGSVIADKTNLTPDEIQGLFREAQTKTAEFARERGIVHDIREFHLPPSHPVISFVFQRQGV
ncbi:MAG: ATP-dependent Clp protease proteolytic subunit [Bryobacteraceae bacterium]